MTVMNLSQQPVKAQNQTRVGNHMYTYQKQPLFPTEQQLKQKNHHIQDKPRIKKTGIHIQTTQVFHFMLYFCSCQRIILTIQFLFTNFLFCVCVYVCKQGVRSPHCLLHHQGDNRRQLVNRKSIQMQKEELEMPNEKAAQDILLLHHLNIVSIIQLRREKLFFLFFFSIRGA